MTDITWIDKDTSYPCVMVRNPWAGHLCGYVILPAGHPVNGVPYADMIDVKVHGGLTYSDSAESLGGMPSEWALGFDCGHVCDLAAPKDEEYVRAQVTKLAQQLKAITDEQVTLHYATLAPESERPINRECLHQLFQQAQKLKLKWLPAAAGIPAEQSAAQCSAAIQSVSPLSPYTRESTLATIDAATRLSEQIKDPGERQWFDMALKVANAELEMGNLEQAVKVVLKAVMIGGVSPIELP